MKRSDFIQLTCLGGVAFACGASKGKDNGKAVQAAEKSKVDPDMFNWKPGDPINIKPVHKTEAEWKKLLSKKEFHILRGAGTEPAFHNAYWDNHKEGIYFCRGCGLPLYSSKTKFKSGTGWPSFYQPLADEVVSNKIDKSLGLTRKEILCAQCGSHLGHLFHDGPEPTGLRYCMDSLSLHFKAMKV